MSTPTTPKNTKTTRATAAIVDLTPKPEQHVRGGRPVAVPTVSEIVVTKDQDCASTNLI